MQEKSQEKLEYKVGHHSRNHIHVSQSYSGKEFKAKKQNHCLLNIMC